MANTATETSSLLEQIEELRQEVQSHDDEARSKLAEARDANDKRNDALKRLSDLTAQAAATDMFDGEAVATQQPRPAQPRPAQPRPAQSRPAAKGGKKPIPTQAGKTQQPRPAQSRPAAAPAKGGKTSGKKGTNRAPEDKRMYGQEMSLPEAIWDVLERYQTKPNLIRKIIPDYNGELGLKVSELNKIIKHEGKWKSSSDNPSPQIQQQCGILRDKGKLGRVVDEMRYYIAEGQTLRD